MDKRLLTNCILFEVNRDVINESSGKTGPFLVTGVLQRANAKNQNARIYPRTILERDIE